MVEWALERLGLQRKEFQDEGAHLMESFLRKNLNDGVGVLDNGAVQAGPSTYLVAREFKLVDENGNSLTARTGAY